MQKVSEREGHQGFYCKKPRKLMNPTPQYLKCSFPLLKCEGRDHGLLLGECQEALVKSSAQARGLHSACVTDSFGFYVSSCILSRTVSDVADFLNFALYMGSTPTPH